MSLGESWQIWALLAAVFAALTAVLAKLGVADLDPDLATLIRTAVVLALLGGGLAASGRLGGVGSVPGGAWGWLAASGAATGASWVCYFRALKLGQASQVAPVDKLSVVFVAVIGALFLGEHLSVTAWSGVALVGTGALLIATG